MAKKPKQNPLIEDNFTIADFRSKQIIPENPEELKRKLAEYDRIICSVATNHRDTVAEKILKVLIRLASEIEDKLRSMDIAFTRIVNPQKAFLNSVESIFNESEKNFTSLKSRIGSISMISRRMAEIRGELPRAASHLDYLALETTYKKLSIALQKILVEKRELIRKLS